MGYATGGRDNPLTRNITDLISTTRTTQKAVAEAAGMTEQTLSRKLTKRADTFTVGELGSIANALGVRVSDLIDDEAA
jgi:DNA-binding Xre family transcriptional regulator